MSSSSAADTPSGAALLFNALLNELGEELVTVSKGRDKSELSQPERRMYIRSTFATIEALTYVWKQIALEAHPDPRCPVITEAERAFAHEQEYKLTDKGDVEIRRTKIALEANIRFAFKLLAKSASISSELNVSGSEWQSLRRAIKIRDRITHPKHISDLTISDEECNDVSAAFGWVLISHIKLATDVFKQTLSNLQRIDAKQ